jgi:hypothetical protein
MQVRLATIIPYGIANALLPITNITVRPPLLPFRMAVLTR